MRVYVVARWNVWRTPLVWFIALIKKEIRMGKMLFALIAFTIPLLGFTPASEAGTIILLNGPSAAGKSSIQNELQKNLSQLYLKIGIDNFFDALLPIPDLSTFETTKKFAQYTNDGVLIRSVSLSKDREGNSIVPLEIGPAGDKIIFGMHHAIAAYANEGNNVIVDYILYKPCWLEDLVQALKAEKVYLIGIKPPLDILEERERKRGTSPVGHARSHYDSVHRGMIYDLEVDTSVLTPEASAQKIQQFMAEHPRPMALQQMIKKME